ncbi:hypothetical protein H0O00_00440 [Candidatus Micrarchaeota archaeon]|nr:hypothetical protein [Candidatus Micrarchaeota archaeon]
MKRPSQTLAQKAMTRRVATELPLDNQLRYGEILGFIAGDGSLGKTHNGVSFTNSDSYCIGRMLGNFSIIFGTKIADFRFYLGIPAATLPSAADEYWRTEIGAPEIKIKNYKKTKKRFGWLKADIHDKQIKENIKSGIERILSGEETDEAILRGFLRGFFAAEGAIIPGKYRREIPNAVQFPQKGKQVPLRIHAILRSFGVESRVVIKQKKADYYCANITGFENYQKLVSLGIVDVHPEKKQRLTEGLGAYRKIVSRKLVLPIKLLKILYEEPRTRTQIYAAVDSYPQRVNGLLYSKTSYLVKNKLIQKNCSEDGTILWSVTEAGRRLAQE